MVFKYCVLGLTSLWSISAHADVEISGTVETRTAISLSQGTLQQNELVFKPELKLDINDTSSLTVIGRFRADTESLINTDKDLEFSLREAYLDTELGNAYLRLGKQQIVWGQADGLKVLDILNPQSFREFILPEFEDSRITLWSVNAEIPIGDMTLQAIWIPDTRYNEIPDTTDLFAFSTPLIIPQTPANTRVIFEEGNDPNNIFSDSDIGLKLSAFTGGWDLTLNYAYHYFDAPVIRARETEQGLSIRQDYERSHLIGTSFSNVFGNITLRGEAAYSTDRFYLANTARPSELNLSSDEISYVIGLDYLGVRDWFISAQIFRSHLLSYDNNIIRPKTETSITSLIRRDFKNETVQAEALLVHNLNNDDGLLQLSLNYEWSTRINLKIGADIFYGDPQGLYGQFTKNDRMTAGIKIGF